MSFHPHLRSFLARLRSLPARSAVATGALVVAALLGAAGLGLLALTWHDGRPAPEMLSSDPAGSSAGDLDETATIPARMVPPGVEQIDDITAGADPDEISRQLSDLPAGRWSYAFNTSGERPSPSVPPTPPPRRVMPALPASALGFAWPLTGVVTSAFDDRHPLGIDIAPGDPLGLVLAARDGTVIAAGGDPCCGYGYFVMLDHGGGITSVYGHLRATPSFQPGEWIERGTVLGVAGDTGHSYGVHLHFEVRVNGVPVDPAAALTGGHLSPLPARIPEETPVAPDPGSGDPHATTPASDAGDPAGDETQPDIEGTTQPAPPTDASPEPESSATPTATTAEASVTPTQTATPEPSPSLAPTPTPVTTVSPTAGAATPTAASTPTATATPTAVAPSPTAPPTATVTATPTVTASPSPSPTPSPTPSPSPSPSPRCEMVRFPATDGFVALESDGVGLQSFIAERCGPDAPTVIVVRPAGEYRCVADLVVQGESRRLLPVPVSGDADRQAIQSETRWEIVGDMLRSGAKVRVACRPPSLSN